MTKVKRSFRFQLQSLLMFTFCLSGILFLNIRGGQKFSISNNSHGIIALKRVFWFGWPFIFHKGEIIHWVVRKENEASGTPASPDISDNESIEWIEIEGKYESFGSGHLTEHIGFAGQLVVFGLILDIAVALLSSIFFAVVISALVRWVRGTSGNFDRG
ncbi:MAG: hypothetical protein HY291_20130 [Planctomycetes bacterium]|nr:hypothetical protein [Planctomycetota bacterium]